MSFISVFSGIRRIRKLAGITPTRIAIVTAMPFFDAI
jgi:hypothetical protein